MDKSKAEKLAKKYVSQQQKGTNCELQLLKEFTEEEEFGWIFFYDSKKYIETEDPAFAVGGNAPFIIDAKTGALEVTGTAYSTEYYIELYKKYQTCHPVEEK